MLNCEQFRNVILKPCLSALQLDTPVAEELLIATMAHESKGGTYLKQEGGPALGIYQMEPKTHDDIWNAYLPSFHDVTYKTMAVCKLSMKPTADMMVYNLYYATCMARIFYLRIPQGLPATSDIDAIWDYYKKWWNTEKGSAEKDDFVRNYLKFIGKEPANAQGKAQRKA